MLVPLRGLQPANVSSLPDNNLQVKPAVRGAECGALAPETGENRPATVQAVPSPLAAIAQALANLSADERAKLAAMLTGNADGKDGNR